MLDSMTPVDFAGSSVSGSAPLPRRNTLSACAEKAAAIRPAATIAGSTSFRRTSFILQTSLIGPLGSHWRRATAGSRVSHPVVAILLHSFERIQPSLVPQGHLRQRFAASPPL